MGDIERSNEQLTKELNALRRQVAELGNPGKLSEQKLESVTGSERWYRMVAENILDVIWVVDIDNPDRLVYVSPSITGLLGYSVEEASARSIDKVFTPRSLQISRRVLAEELALLGSDDRWMTRSRILELELVHRNGSIVPVEVKFSCLPGSDGNPAEIMAVARDISERKNAEQEVQRGTDKLLKAMEDTMQVLARVVEMRDPYTAGHQKRTTELACAIAGNMQLTPERITGLRMAGLIHDVGKVRVPSEILTNPEKLSDAEYAIIQTHPTLGYEILKTIDLPWPVADIVHQHHERLDGSGYPQGLRGENILMESRILAVADVVEAIASHRPYRPALGIDQALQEISKNRGRLYDTQVVDCCLVLFNEQAFTFK